MRQANRDSNVGYPIFESGPEAHMAALALVKMSMNIDELDANCRLWYESANPGCEVPDVTRFFDTVGVRTQENRKDQDLLACPCTLR